MYNKTYSNQRNFIENFRNESLKPKESKSDDLASKAVTIIENVHNAIAVEVYHEAYGLGENATKDDFWQQKLSTIALTVKS